MPTNKEGLIKGLQTLALSFPFAISGPAIYFYKGAQALQKDEPWWLVISAVLMLAAIFFFIKGLRKILDSLFE